MLEYGVKSISTNPTLITKAKEIIKVIDNRNHQTRAFVFPASYEPVIREILKEIEDRNWVEKKKREIKSLKNRDNLDDVSSAGIKSIEEYLQ